MKKLFFSLLKKTIAFLLIFSLIFTPLAQRINSPLKPQPVQAAEQCSAGSSGGGYLSSQVGGVSLDQAATFLADMSDITGAYYDADQDRIVFVGQKNVSLPKFDKDDLAVAIRSLVFNQTIPQVSLEKQPGDTELTQPMQVIFHGELEDTNFGQKLIDADYELKQYVHGYDSNNNPVISSVSSYKSVLQRYIELGPSPTQGNGSRWWILPDLISLKKDDPSDSFVFDTVRMKVLTEPLYTNNSPTWNQAAQDFAVDQTINYDLYAQETPEYFEVKQLGKIVAVVKWIKDTGIVTDFNWAKEYEPKYHPTPRTMPRLTSPWVNGGNGHTYNMSGGVQYDTANLYAADNGTSVALKTASEAVNAPKEDIHWAFTIGGQNYESVAVTADAFRSLGGYATGTTDFSFPTRGDNQLGFSRNYSSYSGAQNGLGRGWDIVPTRFRVSTDYDFTMCPLSSLTIKLPNKISFASKQGYESSTLDPNNCANGWVSDDPAYHSNGSVNVDDASGEITQVKMITTDQISYFFDGNYRLTSITDENNNSIQYSYDTLNRLAAISDTAGHQLTLSYDSANLISQVSDWTGRNVQYGYDDQGNLTTVTDPSGNITTYTYDTNNKLTKVANRLGQTVVENTYTPEAKIATQKDAAGKTSTYTYDTQNKQITIADNLRRTTHATYDDKARILADTDALNKSNVFTYGVEYAPLTITDKNNNKVTNTYDVTGNLTSTTFPDTKKVTYQYDAKNRLTKITDERYGTPGRDTTNTFDATGNLTQINNAGQITNFTYDAFGEALSATDPLSHTVTWTRDNFGNKLTETDPANKTVSFEYDVLARLTKQTDANAKVVSYAYDANGNLLTFTNAAGTTTNTYDKENRLTKTTLPNNSVTEYSYTNAGSLGMVTDPLLSNTTYNYDEYQNLVSLQDALDNTTTNTYDQLNRQTQSTTPLGKVSKWEYDANGNITKRIDANNKATTYLYDAFNRLTKITYPDAKTVTYTYDNRGNMTKMVDPVGTTTYTYDIFDRLLTAKNPYSRQITYTYDSANNLTKITYPDSRAVTYTYDTNNRLISAKDWNNQTTTYTYTDNGLLASKSQPNGVVSNYGYDSTNRLANLEHIKSGTTLAKFAYERDSIGNITKVTEEGSFFDTPSPLPTPSPTPTTNGEDLVITGISTNPVSPAANTNFTINLTVKNQGIAPITNKVVMFGYYYDLAALPDYATSNQGAGTYGTIVNLNAGQETTISFNANTIPTPGTHTIWALADKGNAVLETDENNNASGPLAVTVQGAAATPNPSPAGSPTPVPTSTPTPTPTALPSATPTPLPSPSGSGPDLVVTSITTTPANPAPYTSFTISATIKNQGTVTVPFVSFRLAFYYNLSQPPTPSTAYSSSTSITTTALTPGQSRVYTKTYSYSTSGPHTIYAFVDQGNTITEADETNNVGTKIVTIAASGFFNQLFATIATSLANLLSPDYAFAQPVYQQHITTFAYDALSRIKEANYPDQMGYKYTYDKVDNRLSMQLLIATQSATANYSYNADNQFTAAGSTSATYDSNGNQITRSNPLGTTGFTFDFENRLTKFTPPTGSATTYTYDGNSNRLNKVVGSTTTRFVTDVSSSLSRTLAETNSYNSITKSYVYGLGLISQGTASVSSRDYYLEDGLGNVRFVTDEVGNKVRSTEYDPFGNWRAAQGQSTIHMLFQGQQRDAESGNYFLRARYYDPTLGRFISKDPIKGKLTLPQTQNPYAYSLNNPVNLSDPSGLWYIDVGVSSGILGPLGGGGGVLINDQGITPYIAGGAVTPGKGITVTYSSDNPQQNSTTVNFAANFIGAINVSYPYKNEVVPLTSGDVAVGAGFPAGASATVNHTFGTYCW